MFTKGRGYPLMVDNFRNVLNRFTQESLADTQTKQREFGMKKRPILYITYMEIEEVVKETKGNRAQEEDRITADML